MDDFYSHLEKMRQMAQFKINESFIEQNNLSIVQKLMNSNNREIKNMLVATISMLIGIELCEFDNSRKVPDLIIESFKQMMQLIYDKTTSKDIHEIRDVIQEILLLIPAKE